MNDNSISSLKFLKLQSLYLVSFRAAWCENAIFQLELFTTTNHQKYAKSLQDPVYILHYRVSCPDKLGFHWHVLLKRSSSVTKRDVIFSHIKHIKANLISSLLLFTFFPITIWVHKLSLDMFIGPEYKKACGLRNSSFMYPPSFISLLKDPFLYLLISRCISAHVIV